MRHARSIKLATQAVPPVGEGSAPAASKIVEIWTDGACKGNPGPGGWGALLRYGEHEKELWGGQSATTNNRMELTAVIEALASLKERCRVVVHTDSQYVKNGILEWMAQWIRRGWRTSEKLAAEAARHDIEWRWVRGHAGDPGNERADELANRGVDEVMLK